MSNNALVFVSDDVKIDFLQIDNITSLVKTNFDILDATYFLDKKNKELFLNIDDVIFKYDNIIIFTQKKNFPIVNKIISTITKDNLELKMNGLLIPSKSILFEEGSYLLEYGKKRINVLEYTKFQKLPNLLIRSRDEVKYMHIHEISKENALTLIKPIASNLSVNISMCEIVDSLILLRAQSSEYGDLYSFVESLEKLLDNKLILTRDVIAYIISSLHKKNHKISFAESCTGGYLSNLFIHKNGASNVIDANIVCYANSIKEGWLGVKSETLKRFGVVSEKCVEEMLEGVVSITNANCGVAISGIAGPNGGSEEKPVGTVYIGVTYNDKKIIKKLNLIGDRIHIQKSTAWSAIKLLLEIIEENK